MKTMPMRIDRVGRLARMLCMPVMLWAGPAHAIDNPDAPNYQAPLPARAQPFEKRLADVAVGPEFSPAAVAHAKAYAKFLDAELNQAYRQLREQLRGDNRQALTFPQRQWGQFHDAETEFIGANWSPKNFGSSSEMSRAEYRATLVRQRVTMLLAYRQNYPPRSR